MYGNLEASRQLSKIAAGISLPTSTEEDSMQMLVNMRQDVDFYVMSPIASRSAA